MGLYPRIETSHLADNLRGLRSNNWYVHGADGNDASPGDRPEKPLATLQEALDRCNGGDYDSIYITRGVVTGETTPFVLNKANVRIIGDPYAVAGQSTNCAVIATDDTDCFTFSASDVSISGLTLYAGATSAGVGFASVAWSQRNLIEKCCFLTGARGIYSGNVADSPGHHLTIQDCLFMGSMGASGGIDLGSNGSWMIIRRNYFDQLAGVAISVTGGGAGVAAGRILDNIIVAGSDIDGIGITLGGDVDRFFVMGNAINDAAPAVMTNNGFVDVGTTNIWIGNVEGAAGFTDTAPV